MFAATGLQSLLGLLWLFSAVRAETCAGKLEVGDDVLSMLQVGSDVSRRAPAPVGVVLPRQEPVVMAQKPGAAAPVVASAQLLVEVPEGASPGDQIQAQSPDGQMLQFPLPSGATAGQEVPIRYTPLTMQLAPVEAVPVPSPMQPVSMDDVSTSGTSMQVARPAATSAATSNTLQTQHAMSDAVMQREAVNKVMQNFAVMQHMDTDEQDSAELAYAKAETAKKAAELEAAADMDSATAAENVVNYKAWKRSNALKDAAIAKNELAERMGEYNVARTSAVSIAGTDAAWKAAVPGHVPSPTIVEPLPVHSPAFDASVLQTAHAVGIRAH